MLIHVHLLIDENDDFILYSSLVININYKNKTESFKYVLISLYFKSAYAIKNLSNSKTQAILKRSLPMWFILGLCLIFSGYWFSVNSTPPSFGKVNVMI